MNFAPGVAVALVRTDEELATQEGRLGRLAMPPAGGGPPPPMDSMHAAGIFNCLFYVSSRLVCVLFVRATYSLAIVGHRPLVP